MKEILGFLLIQILHFNHQVQAQEGIDPIPANELYGQDFNKMDNKFPECIPNKFSSGADYATCLKASVYHTDYGCRYHRLFRPRCYCCGHYYHYIEHGPVCTKFCLNSDKNEHGVGQKNILITLPFNWGWDTPDKITLDDGTEVTVKCDFFDGDNYGCNDGNSDGNRKQFTTNERKNNNEKLKIKSNTQPPKRRTTTISNPSKSKLTSTETTKTYRTTTGLSLTTTKKQTTTTTKRTTTKRTTTKRTTTRRTTRRKITLKEQAGVRVSFAITPVRNKKNSITSKKTTERPRIFGHTYPTSMKTNIVSGFGAKLTTIRTTTTAQEHVWGSKKNREPKETTLVQGLPVWG